MGSGISSGDFEGKVIKYPEVKVDKKKMRGSWKRPDVFRDEVSMFDIERASTESRFVWIGID